MVYLYDMMESKNRGGERGGGEHGGGGRGEEEEEEAKIKVLVFHEFVTIEWLRLNIIMMVYDHNDNKEEEEDKEEEEEVIIMVVMLLLIKLNGKSGMDLKQARWGRNKGV